MSKKLSIIIPVYGVEEYIEEFILSIINQLKPEVELIIINDGTNDRSIEIVKEIIKNYDSDIQDCFLFLEQYNQGQSVARNNGLKKATGEFIGFLDPDDIVYPTYISSLIDTINKNPSVDVIHINAVHIDERSNKKDILFLAEKTEVLESNRDYMLNLIKKDLWQPWFRFFNKKFISELYFVPGMLFEDKFLFAELYSKSINHVANIEKVLVGYRVHNNSSFNHPKNLDRLLTSAYDGIVKYSSSEQYEMKLVYVSYLKCYLGLITRKDIKDVKPLIKNMNHYFVDVQSIKDISTSEKLRFSFPYLFVVIRKLVRKLLNK
ncbi:glycosyltransferase [Acinetobacter soli]|uniref:glycosyltransferase n=1 Tax=Acinetobacter soli TaxID=487316 RepID=UPI001230D678|nr:glycosyltransferase [Acinetobacter soli]